MDIWKNVERAKASFLTFEKKHKQFFRAGGLLLSVLFFFGVLVHYYVKFSLPLRGLGAPLYLLDYHFYYGTRTFIGSVFTLLTDHISADTIGIVNLAAYLVSVLLLLVLLFRSCKTAFQMDHPALIALISVFLLCPYSILQFAGWIGLYDVWLCLGTLLCCFLTSSRAKWVVPVICVCAVFTHYAFVFSFFPVIVCMQLFLIFKKDSKSRASDIACFVLTFLFTAASAVWCGFFAQATVKMSESELYEYVCRRLGQPPLSWDYIQSYYFYGESNFKMLGSLVKYARSATMFQETIFLFLPFFLVFAAVWVGCLIKSDRKIDRFKYLTFLAALVASSAIVLFVVEANRWRTAAVLSQIMLFCFCLKEKDEPFYEFLAAAKQKWLPAVLYALTVYGALILLTVKPQSYYLDY